MNSEPAPIIAKAASAATYTGGGSAFVSGSAAAAVPAAANDVVFGLTTSQWSVVGILGGLVIGLLGFLATLYFERRRTLAAERRAAEGKA